MSVLVFVQFSLSYTESLWFSSSKMAVPPSYSDLGKAAKDIFSKGYGECCFSQLLTARNSQPVQLWCFTVTKHGSLIHSADNVQ